MSCSDLLRFILVRCLIARLVRRAEIFECFVFKLLCEDLVKPLYSGYITEILLSGEQLGIVS